MTDMEIVALVVARTQEEVEKLVGPIPDPGSVWGRSVMLAMKDVREARKIKHAEAVENARCPDCKCERDLHSGAGTHKGGCSYFPL